MEPWSRAPVERKTSVEELKLLARIKEQIKKSGPYPRISRFIGFKLRLCFPFSIVQQGLYSMEGASF